MYSRFLLNKKAGRRFAYPAWQTRHNSRPGKQSLTRQKHMDLSYQADSARASSPRGSIRSVP
ncbi:hypothetical protein ACWGXD_32300, partial [Klebsiella pneumoniae]